MNQRWVIFILRFWIFWGKTLWMRMIVCPKIFTKCHKNRKLGLDFFAVVLILFFIASSFNYSLRFFYHLGHICTEQSGLVIRFSETDLYSRVCFAYNYTQTRPVMQYS